MTNVELLDRAIKLLTEAKTSLKLRPNKFTMVNIYGKVDGAAANIDTLLNELSDDELYQKGIDAINEAS